jgi:acetyl-CoA carboxylase biotin carboxyl carrier protein
VRETVLVNVERAAGGEFVVHAPRIGLWHGPPREGAWVGPGSTVGRLHQLERRFDLLLPDLVAGRVVGAPLQAVVGLQYGEVMFRIAPVREGVSAAGSSAEVDASETATRTFTLVAPTAGVFYRRPRPDARAFLEPGQRVERGQAVGLIEVMKTFNQIVYDGPGFPDAAEVVEFRCGEGEEVRAGQVLLLLR